MSKVRLTPKRRIRQRYVWFQETEQLGSVALACRHLEVSQKTC